jgi:hypothetical protein
MNRYRIQVGYSGVVDFVVTTDAELDPNAVADVAGDVLTSGEFDYHWALHAARSADVVLAALYCRGMLP